MQVQVLKWENEKNEAAEVKPKQCPTGTTGDWDCFHA